MPEMTKAWELGATLISYYEGWGAGLAGQIRNEGKRYWVLNMFATLFLAAVLFFRPAGPAWAEDSEPPLFDLVEQAATESAADPTSPYPSLPPGIGLAPSAEPPEKAPEDSVPEPGLVESGEKAIVFAPAEAVIKPTLPVEPIRPNDPAVSELDEVETAGPGDKETSASDEVEAEGAVSAGARTVFAEPAPPDEEASPADESVYESIKVDEPLGADEPDGPESFEELLQRQEGLEFEYEGRIYIWRDGIPFERNANGTFMAVVPPENLYEVRSDGSRWLSREADGTVYIDVAPKVWTSISFEHNSDEIMEDSKPVLDVFGVSMGSEALGEHRLLIIGHTSSDGNQAYNLKLSRRRAQSVGKYLSEEHHIDPGRLILHGYGDQRPLAGNETEEGRAANRRVEFILLSPLAE